MNNNLNTEQQSLITMYMNQYNITNNHIEQLCLFLDDIRNNIFNIMIENHTNRGINSERGRGRERGRERGRDMSNNNPRNTNYNTNTNFNTNSNTQYRGFNPYVRYNYNMPISPSIYNGNTNNNNRRNSVNSLPTNTPTPSLNVTPPIPTTRNIPTTRPIIDSLYTPNEATALLNTFLTTDEAFFNNTVVVRPTNAQIQQASRLIKYGDIENPLSESCPISLEDFNEANQVRQLLHCGHIFHTRQFQQWFESNVRCPVCRYDIRNYNSLSNSSSTGVPRTPHSSTGGPPSSDPSSSVDPPSSSVDPPSSDPAPISISNINVVRDPISNEANEVSFDIDDPSFTNDFINEITRNLFQSILNPNPNSNSNNSNNNNNRILLDPSNNIVMYETILRMGNQNTNRPPRD